MNLILAPTKAPSERPKPPSPRTRTAPASQSVPPRGSWAGQGLSGFLRGRSEQWYDRVALFAMGTTAVVLGMWNLNGAAVYMDDEGTYTAQAFSVLEGHLAPYTYRYDHPPVGWIQLGALAWIPQMLGVGDGTVIGATRYAMVPFFVATALLIYLIARRLEIRRPFAVLAVVLFVLSPLSLVYGRQIFLDNIGVPWLLLAFWMVMSPRAALWHHIWAGAFFAVAVLSKETLAVFGPALLLALLNRPVWSNRAFSVMGFLVVGGTVLNFYPLMAILSGELWSRSGHVSLQDALVFQFLSREGSGALWDPASARAERLNSWLYYDQHLIAAGVVAGTVCLLRRRTAWIPAALASFAVPVVVGHGYLPGMYIIGALPFLALAVGAGLETMWERLEKHTATLTVKGRLRARRAGVACLVIGLLPVLWTQWIEQDRRLLTQQANTDWASALEWVQEHVPEEDTILVPYVMWPDLNAADGRNNPWSVVATEKADLDPQFLVEHPGGWREIEWVVLGPYTDETIDGLDLGTARQALDRSVPVHNVGEWSVHRVQRD